MSLESLRVVALAAATALAAAVPAPARAQTGRTYLAPSFSAGGAYDDNIFFSARPERRGGSFLRLGPTLQAGWQPRPAVALFAAYGFEAEAYPEYPELNDTFARQRASAGVNYRHRRTTASLGGGFDQSHTASDLIEEAGLQLGRRNGRGYSGAASVEQGVGRGGALGAHYGYRYVDYGAASDEGRPSGSHVVALSWTQQFGRATTTVLRAGPRLSDGIVTADVSATLNRRFRRSSLSLGYGRGRYTAPARDVDVETLTAAGSRQLGRSLQVSVSATAFRHWGDEAEGHGLRGVVSVARKLERWLFVVASYQHMRQSRTAALLLSGATGDWLFRNVFYAGLSVTKPRRSDSVAGAAPGR